MQSYHIYVGIAEIDCSVLKLSRCMSFITEDIILGFIIHTILRNEHSEQIFF